MNEKLSSGWRLWIATAAVGAVMAAKCLAGPLVYVPFAGTNEHTGFEAWPPLCMEGLDTNAMSNGCVTLSWEPWMGWRAFDTNFHRIAPLLWDLANTNAQVAIASAGTVTNATNTTWGSGAGLLRWDTNYFYVSLGTNHWGRLVVTNW